MAVMLSDTIEGMVLIPAGEFQMGGETYPEEQPVHPVHLDAFYTDLRLYRQLFTAGPTVATALRLGVTNGLRANRGAELISFERFWAGGSTTVRGYAERGLGPLDSAGNHRGDIQFIFNTELRFPIYKPIRGVLFFDTGNVWRSLDTFAFTLAELPAAVGAGIRLQWGAFTGGVDYAVPLRDIPSAAATPLYWRLGSTF